MIWWDRCREEAEVPVAMRGLVVGVLILGMLAGCDGNSTAPPTASRSTAAMPALPPPPWALAELTAHPCAVLDETDNARFVLDPVARAETPPRNLPACSWSSIQSAPAGSFTIRFAPSSTDLSDLSQRQVRDPLEQQITIDGRAAVKPTVRPDGRAGSCNVQVSVPSGGSFYLGIAVPGLHTGVDWDVCRKVVEVATVIRARLR
ncbi:DUF3558 family protein [Nocardia brasiliensis]|uniref:DUF3558 family protein n=1 Tax=Nocardia brasiliensis TaxID=37326 RepID=UPI003D8F1EB6